MTQAQHTSLIVWEQDAEHSCLTGDYTPHKVCIGQQGGIALAELEGYAINERREFAAFIVHACNSHEDLVSALSLMMQCHRSPHCTNGQKAWDIAKTVLKKAKAGAA